MSKEISPIEAVRVAVASNSTFEGNGGEEKISPPNASSPASTKSLQLTPATTEATTSIAIPLPGDPSNTSSMHTVPISPSTPISRNENNVTFVKVNEEDSDSRSSTMAIPTDASKVVDSTEEKNNFTNKPSVVTPEGAKSGAETPPVLVLDDDFSHNGSNNNTNDDEKGSINPNTPISSSINNSNDLYDEEEEERQNLLRLL